MSRTIRSGGSSFYLLRALVLAIAAQFCCPGHAAATITQGDFSVYGFLKTQEGLRWGEAGSREKPVASVGSPTASSQSGGSFDFNRWDLVMMRQTVDIPL